MRKKRTDGQTDNNVMCCHTGSTIGSGLVIVGSLTDADEKYAPRTVNIHQSRAPVTTDSFQLDVKSLKL